MLAQAHLRLLNEAKAFSLGPGEGLRIVGVVEEVTLIGVDYGPQGLRRVGRSG